MMTPLEALFILAAAGYVLGGISVGNMQLGTSGVLLAALYFGHLGYEVPGIVRDLGLALFVGSVGLTAGPRFFRNLRRNALSYGLLALLIVGSGAVATAMAARLFDIPRALAVGIYTGALTTTPGLAVALEATGDSAASIGYGIAYPFGVVGVVLFVQLMPHLLRKNLREEVAKLSQTPDREAGLVPTLLVREFVVENPDVDRKTLAELAIHSRTGAVVSRVKRGRQVFAALGNTVLLKGDGIRAVGTEEALAKLEAVVGRQAQVPMDEPGVEVRDLAVESREVAGKTVCELNAHGQYGIILTRVRRAGVEFTPGADTVLEQKDVVRAVGAPSAMDRFQAVLGRQRRPLERTGMLALALVIAVGLLISRLRLEIPGVGAVSLGIAGGPLMAGLIVGHFGGVGRWSLRPSGQTLGITREMGLMLFLAGAGVAAGRGFVATVAKYGWLLFASGAGITVIPMMLGFAASALFFKLSLPDNLGSICGGMTSTPALGALITAAGSDEVAASYAATYPFALVLVVLATQALAILL
ncbi:MAG: YidE/YbjL duplication [Firmicutes bacterium]|jgi:putative transport protein|nr:YidE/YbjL duplication [Bacillota bacterium]MDH7495157.1 TrkA C-terminal domain-containing protein [Bacillota bacterium]